MICAITPPPPSSQKSVIERFFLSRSVEPKVETKKVETKELWRAEEEFLEKNKNVSLLEQHKELQEIADQRKETNIEKMRREEDRILQVIFQFFRFLQQN